MKALIFILFFFIASRITAQRVFDGTTVQAWVDNNKKEYDLQTDLNKGQQRILIVQNIAKSKSEEFKTKVTQIHQRFQNMMALLSDAVSIAEFARITNDIISNEGKLLNLSQQHPYYAPIVIEAHFDLSRQATRIVQMISAFVLVGTDFTQMNASDRRTLIRYAIGRFDQINGTILNLIRIVQVTISIRKPTLGLYGDYINRDKEIFKEVNKKIIINY